jgi:hypothetical protein
MRYTDTGCTDADDAQEVALGMEHDGVIGARYDLVLRSGTWHVREDLRRLGRSDA